MDRKLLKDHAKKVMKESPFEMFGVALILSLTGGDYQPLIDLFSRVVVYIRSNRFDLGVLSRIERAISQDYAVFGFILAVIFIVAGLLFNIFIVNNLRIGAKSFYIKSVSGEGVVFDRLFKNFREGSWKNQGLKMFRVDLEIILFMFLLIVPGIIKSYQYYWVPYLLAEDPSLSAEEATRMSRAMTSGKKMDIFIAEISFLGWYLLASILFPFIVMPIVDSYRECTFATYYGMIGSRIQEKSYSNFESI